MSEEELTQEIYLCPLVGSGRTGDERRPLIADLLKRRSWAIQLLATPTECLTTLLAYPSEHQWLMKQLKITPVTNLGAIMSLPLTSEIRAEMVKKWPILKSVILQRPRGGHYAK